MFSSLLKRWKSSNRHRSIIAVAAGSRFNDAAGSATRREAYHRRLRCEPLEDRRLLSVLTVLNNNDSGAGSLRAAIAAAAAGDTIQFAPSLAGDTITLASTLTISTSLQIAGPGAKELTVSGNKSYGVFDISSASTTVAISGLTITDGSASGGGGVFNNGTLTLTNCTISGSTATGLSSTSGGGAIFNKAMLSVTNCTLSANYAALGGGAIYNYSGTATVTNSTFSNNSAYYSGGAICNGGTLTVTNSTISGSSVELDGGGIESGGTLTVTNSTISGSSCGDAGGGIYESSGTVTLTSSTISYDSANNYIDEDGGGILNEQGTLTVTSCTLYDNLTSGYGGAIENGGTLTVTGSTISGNSAGSDGGGICTSGQSATLANTVVAGDTNYGPSPDLYGSVTANYCLIQNTTGATISGSHNILSQSANLGSLGNYGGPTQTIPLLPGSPAINSGSVALAVGPNHQPLTTDQRGTGYPSTVGSTIDIGALEAQDTMTALLPSSLSPSAYGQPVTFTATVSPLLQPGNVAPTGTVTFYNSGSAIGTGTLAVVGGLDKVTFTTSALPVGTDAITAAYTSGDANFAPSAASAAFSQAVAPYGTTTAVASSANPSAYGQPVTFTATVTTSGPGTFDNGGTVTFYDGATSLGTATLAGGAAVLTTSSLPAGSGQAITATYSGDGNFGTSRGA